MIKITDKIVFYTAIIDQIDFSLNTMNITTTAPNLLTVNSSYDFQLEAYNLGLPYDLTGLNVHCLFVRPGGLITDDIVATSKGVGFAIAPYSPPVAGIYTRSWKISDVPISSVPLNFTVV